jgi:hypothetical protein
MMNGWFDHSVSNGVVMQMSHAELAICHAAVAIGALQEALSELSEDTNSRMQRFAIYQHSRSIELLRSRMSSNDPNVKRTVLICCVLFIVFEIIYGNYDQAVMHLQNGLHILGTKKLRYQALYQEYPTFESNVENSLVAIMLHLDLQSAAFGWSNMHEQLDIANLPEEGSHWPGEVQFRSVQDAWIMRDRIFLQFCMFSRLCEPLSAAEVAANYAVLSKEQKKQQIQLLMFLQALDRLENTALWQGSLTERDRSAIELLRMHHAGISVITDTCLIKSSDEIGTAYEERFARAIDLAERITARVLARVLEKGDSTPIPSLLMETGVVSPMYFVIEKCHNRALAQRALKIMESWPHREGLWDSRLAAALAREKVTNMNIRE